MNRAALTIISATLVFIAVGVDAVAARQTRDPDAYLRALAAISPQAAHSARASCLSRRTGSQETYNRCLRAAFLAAGGPASAPPPPTVTLPERPERPTAVITLDALAAPPRPRSSDQPGRSGAHTSQTSDCPTFDQCAVQIGAFTSTAIAERELEVVARRFPELTRPFKTFMRPVTARDGRTVYRTMFVDGSRIEAHALCDALKAAGRDCVVR